VDAKEELVLQFGIPWREGSLDISSVFTPVSTPTLLAPSLTAAYTVP
jgi:hypothetical protein